MPRVLGFAAAVVAAAGIVVPGVQAATTVMVLGVGSSAMFDTMAFGAWFNLAGAAAHHHYTTKGHCPALGSCAVIHDLRSGAIPNQAGSLWVVWSANESEVWAYLGADSVVGMRAFFASPRATLQVDPSLMSTPGQNLVPTSQWGNDASELPVEVFNALNNAVFTTVFSDARPEDAKAAQVRACSPLNTDGNSGLGYCSNPAEAIGTSILSAYSTSEVTPVAFNLFGTDPITHAAVPAYRAIEIGATPIVFFGNRTPGSSLATITTHDLSLTNVQRLFAQEDCDAHVLGGHGGITIVQNEPLSGGMLTAEFTNFRLSANNFTVTQEFGVNPATASGNPLNQPCGPGSRKRAIGTSEMVNTAILNTPGAMGYALYSAGNFSSLANNPNFLYFTLGGADPICTSYTSGDVECGVIPRPHPPLLHLRDGSYRSWAMLRAVTDAAGVHLANTQALVTATQNSVDCTTGDFVPVVPVANHFPGCTQAPDPGLTLYRSHYSNPQYPSLANNGLHGAIDSGSEVGGCIESIPPLGPGILGCRQ
jgi:hypothetical protein